MNKKNLQIKTEECHMPVSEEGDLGNKELSALLNTD